MSARDVVANYWLGEGGECLEDAYPRHRQVAYDRADEIIAAFSAAGYVIATKEQARQATRASCYVMDDWHTFRALRGSTIDEIVHDAAHNGERGDSLCPFIVLSGEVELRRVGKMVHRIRHDERKPEDDKALAAWIADVKADPDIANLLAALHHREGGTIDGN